MIDYIALLYDPVYREIGVPATFTAGTTAVDISVIDDTRPKVLPAGSAEVRSVGPGAFVRIQELEQNGVIRGDWLDAVLNFNGRNWQVRSYELRGSPNGEDFGEVRFMLKVAAMADGGGEVPDWVPANAKIHIDFLGGSPQGRAWNDGAEVAIDTLLGSDPGIESDWGDTIDYDPANLTADGYVALHTVAFIGAARIILLDQATLVLRFKQVTGYPGTTFKLALVSEGVAHGLECDLSMSNGEAEFYSYDGAVDLLIPDIISDAVGTVNALAGTVTQIRLDMAVNGSSAETSELTEVERPVPFVSVVLSPSAAYAMQSITIYDPLPDTTGLSELSAVG